MVMRKKRWFREINLPAAKPCLTVSNTDVILTVLHFYSTRGSNVKGIWLVAVLLVAALAFYVANRLSDDTIAFALGVVFGVLAAVPCSLLLIAGMNRSQRRERDTPAYPPMFVMPGGYDQGGSQYIQQPPAPPALPERVVRTEYSEW